LDDVIPRFKVNNILLHQDSKAAILLQGRGVNSRGKRSRHIDIRFSFVKYRIEKGDVEIAFCGTKNMIADSLTKPLQGRLFRKFRDEIMGINPTMDKSEGMCWETAIRPNWDGRSSHHARNGLTTRYR
jgi:hypothetical protein